MGFLLITRQSCDRIRRNDNATRAHVTLQDSTRNPREAMRTAGSAGSREHVGAGRAERSAGPAPRSFDQYFADWPPSIGMTVAFM